MALAFDHQQRHINVPQADAVPLMIQYLINQIREHEASERGICYEQIADAAGKDDLGSGVETGITVNLRSTWELRFETGSYPAAITGGNLADPLVRVHHNAEGPSVLIQSSAAATVVDGSGSTGPTAGQVAEAVWSRALEGLSAEEVMRVMLAALAGRTAGVGTNTEQYLSRDGGKPRVTATFDAQGNRTTVVVDGS